MLDGLGIKGIEPIDDNPSRHPNGRNRNYGQKFSLEEEGEEKEQTQKKKRSLRKKPRKKKPPAPGSKDGGIDIVI